MAPLKHLLAVGLFAALVGEAWGGTASTVTAVELKKSPASDAKTVASLPADTEVEVLSTRRFWKEIKAGSVRGWVRGESLSMDNNGGDQDTSGITAAANKARTGSSSATVPTGHKGWGATQEAQSDSPGGLDKLKSFGGGFRGF